MPTTNNVKGNLLGLYISTDGGTNYTLVGSATSATLSINNDTLDVTKKSASGNRELMYGLQTATVTAEGFVKYDDTQGSEQLRTVALTASDDSNYLVRFTTGVTGDKEVYFNAIITSFEETAAVNEIATYSITLESAGAISEATVSRSNPILQAWHLPSWGCWALLHLTNPHEYTERPSGGESWGVHPGCPPEHECNASSATSRHGPG